MNLTTILSAMKLVGAATPAFKALFDQVLPLFSSSDQTKLKDAYQRARTESDAADADLRDAVSGAQQ
jgi:hypothetical protein